MNYSHLSLEERHYIEFGREEGKSLNRIAKELDRSQSTVSREVKRNIGLRGYRYKQAHYKSQTRDLEKPKAIKLTDKMKQYIRDGLEEDWSPEQIAGKLREARLGRLHHETIYQYILADKRAGGKLYLKLRHKNKPYRKRYGSSNNKTGIPNRVDIDERPAVANRRRRIGDWEADTIIGKNHKGAIVTLDDRKSKLRLAAPLQGKKADALTKAVIDLLSPLKAFVHTMTFDNGKEFCLHEQLANALSCKTYFAKPYHSWERGQNENANGLLRQYFPKSMELTHVTLQAVFKAIDKLNSRPRKCLGFKTPYEVFQKQTGIDVRQLLHTCAFGY